MEPIEIKILMMRAGITHVALAKKLGITDPMIHQVISGHRHTSYIRKSIADAVGKPMEKLWPTCAKASAGKPNHKLRKAA